MKKTSGETRLAKKLLATLAALAALALLRRGLIKHLDKQDQPE